MTDKQVQRANNELQQSTYLAKEEFQAEMQKANAKNALWQNAMDLAVRAGKTESTDIISFAKDIVDAMDTYKEVAYNTPEPTLKKSSIIQSV